MQSVGGSSLTDAMSNSARQYLDGVSPENADTLSDSVSRVLENMTSDSQSAIRTALGGLLRVAVIVLLASAARGFSGGGGRRGQRLDRHGGGTWLCGSAPAGISRVCCRSAATSLDQISVFSGTLQPVLATVLATGGNTATANRSAGGNHGSVRPGDTAGERPACSGGVRLSCHHGGGCRGRQRHAARHRRRHKISLTSGVLKLILTLFTRISCDSGRCFRQRGPHDAKDRKTCRVRCGSGGRRCGFPDATETMLSGAALLRGLDRHFRDAVRSGYLLCAVRSSGSKLFCASKAGAAVLSPLCSGLA